LDQQGLWFQQEDRRTSYHKGREVMRYKPMVNKIKQMLEGEISSSQPIIDGDEEVTDGTDDIIIGRYEYAEQLLEQIKQWENE